MSDFTVPSYRIRPARSGFEMPWRLVMLAVGGLAVLGACGGTAWYLLKGGSRSVPVIEADTRPIRIRPDDPGGMRVANQDERIFDARRGAAGTGQAAGQGGQAGGQRLAPEPERPDVNALRQAAQNRPQPSPPQPAARSGQPAPTAAAPTAPPAPAVSGPPAGSLIPLPSNAASPTAPPQSAASQTPATPTPAAVPARPNNPRILIQVGALGSEEAARTEWDRIKRRVPEIGDRQPSFPRADRGADQAPVWRIRTNGFPDADAARVFCEGVRAKSVPCTVIGG